MSIKPFLAAKQFPNDCFGELHDPSVRDCRICLVAMQCAMSMLSNDKVSLGVVPLLTYKAELDDDSFMQGSKQYICYETMLSFGEQPFSLDDLRARLSVRFKREGEHTANLDKIIQKTYAKAIALNVLQRVGKGMYQLKNK